VPGRYEHNRDPQLAALLHHVTEEGWGNDSVGDLDEDGFHASLLVVEPPSGRSSPRRSTVPSRPATGSLPRISRALSPSSNTRHRRPPGTPSTTYPTTETVGRRRRPPSPRPGRSAAGTRSRWPGPSSATPTTWTRRARCCRRQWTPTATGRRLVHQRPWQPLPPQPLAAVTKRLDRCKTGHGPRARCRWSGSDAIGSCPRVSACSVRGGRCPAGR
jgi:hypothetical protein